MTSTTFDTGTEPKTVATSHTWRDRPDSRMSEDAVAPAGSHWSVARRPFWWALLATILLSTAGGLAIYFIHSTTPATGASQQMANRDASKGRVAGAVTRPMAGTPGTSAAPKGDSAGSTPLAAQSATLASPSISGQRPGSDQTQPQSAPREADRPGAAASVIAGAPATAPMSGTNLPRAAPEGSLQWSKSSGTATPATAAAPGSTGRNPSEGAGVFPPTVVNPSKGGSPSNPQANGPAVSGTTAAPRPSEAATAPATSAQTPSVRPSPNASVGSLKDSQEKQCADSNFLSRLVCDERVRLRYCRDRWNEHPDCMVNAQQREP